MRRQRATRSIREEAGHGGGVAAEPQLGAEGAVLDPAGFADVTPLVLGGGADAVLDVRVVGAGQAQVLEGAPMMRVLVSIMLVSTSPQAPLSG